MTRSDRIGSLLSHTNFSPERRGHVGVEREFVLCRTNARPVGAWCLPDIAHVPVARSENFLAAVNDPAWTYELSACQVEHRTEPLDDILKIRDALAHSLHQGRRAAESIGLELCAIEVAPEFMPLDVYPHDERYARIAASIPPHVLSAACRVTGTHLHVGCGSAEEALAVYNALVPHLDRLATLGDHSHGERLRLYKTMAQNWQPPVYTSTEHLGAVARQQGFADNLRNCWHLIRLSRHGTVELRMFGMTDNVEEITNWILVVRGILRSI